MADALKKSQPTAKKARLATTARRPAAERERLNFRLDARIKQRAEDAAAILGQDLSTFAESALDEKAQAVIEREERLVLSEQDFARFVDSLNNPAPPTQKLIEARRAVRQMRQEQPEGNW